jgi:hypothetical protein
MPGLDTLPEFDQPIIWQTQNDSSTQRQPGDSDVIVWLQKDGSLLEADRFSSWDKTSNDDLERCRLW